MKRCKAFGLSLAVSSAVWAADVVWVNLSPCLSVGITPDDNTEISYAATDYSTIKVTSDSEVVASFLTYYLNDITLGETDGAKRVVFNGDEVRFYYPDYIGNALDDGLEITSDGAHLTIYVADYTTLEALELTVTGSTDNGQIKVIGDIPVKITLDNANITNKSGSAINTQAGKTEIVLVGENVLCDASEYVIPDGEKDKGTIYSKKALTISGDGSLTATGLCKQAICTDKKFTLAGGDITLNVSATDTKGIKADGDVTISDGILTLNVSGDQAKGIKTESDFIMTGGTIVGTLAGNAVVTDGDPSYCSAIKADGAVDISGGKISIEGTGMGCKGISCDSIATFTGGDFYISLTGDGAVYTDANGNYDTYSSTCITVDQDIYIYGGNFELSNSGSAGKCIKGDQEIVFGAENGNGPTIVALTSGAKIKESDANQGAGPGGWAGAPGGGPGGGGWGPGGGGWDDQADYSNPKVIKAEGNLTVNSGQFTISSSSDGGEGLESKATLTVNGGIVEIETVDDCINASSHVQINGGALRCVASGNDAIDSNGTLTIAGGIVIAVGSSSPEAGFDCDNNKFAITGGTIVGLGGDTSTPTSSACTQRVVVYQANITNGTTYTIVNPAGEQVMSFKSPKTINGKMVMSDAGITNDGTYTIYSGGTLISGTETWELTTGAAYSPGTKLKTFTPTSMVTTVR